MIPATRFPSDSYTGSFPAQPRMHHLSSNSADDAKSVAYYSSAHQNGSGAWKPANIRVNVGSNSRGYNEISANQLSGSQKQKPFMASPGGFYAPYSPVSDLFEHMYKSSISSNSVPSNLSTKKFEGDENKNITTVNGDSVASYATPLRSCSSQGDLSHVDSRQTGVMSKGVREIPQMPDYDNVILCQNINAIPRYPRKFSDKGLKFQAVESVSGKDANLPASSSNLDGRSSGKESTSSSYSKSISPLDLDSGIDQDFVDSEEPLPHNRRPEHASRLGGSKSSLSSNPAPSPLPNLKDVHLTVFMRDADSNKSFDLGASKFVNAAFQRQPGNVRTGSMPYRVKSTGSVTAQKSSSPTRVMRTNGRPEAFTPLTPLKYQKTSEETGRPPEERSNGKVSTSENSSRPSAYDGPRLISVGKIYNDLDRQSSLRSNADSNDKTNAFRLARRLYELDGFRKSDVAKHLGKSSDFAQLVRQAYLQQFDFSSLSLDESLRHFLTYLVLSGETQERERILAEFSSRFVGCNPHFFGSQDSCHMLVCSIMLLNTDLHGKNGGKKMTVHEFVENLSGLNGGADFPKDLLKTIYNSIRNEPIEFITDEVDGSSDLSKDGQSAQSQPNPFLDIPDPSKANEFKTGYLMRKCCLESDGRQTPMGKRGWKKFRASLRDLILYLHKDEHGFSCGTTFDDTSNAVRIHHSLATDASDYTKRHCVFRLRTADWSEYLFQASDSSECQAWIDVINQVTATFSAPPLPGAVGSQMKFQRPLMPSTCSRLSLKDQLAQHQQTLTQIEKDLADHRESCPEKGSRQRDIQDYLEKEAYLDFEQRRFQTYCRVIEKQIISNVNPNKSSVNEEYFQRAKSSHISVHSPKKLKDASDHSETDGDKRTQSPTITHSSSVPHNRSLHPAKSVPALLFESLV